MQLGKANKEISKRVHIKFKGIIIFPRDVKVHVSRRRLSGLHIDLFSIDQIMNESL